MQMPRSHAWTPTAKWLIVMATVALLFVVSSLIYQYERYYRPSDKLFFGAWQGVSEDTGDGVYWQFRRDHTFSSFILSPMSGEKLPFWEGRWHAGGPFLYLRFSSENSREVVALRFDISSEHLTINLPRSGDTMWSLERVSDTGRTSNQAMQPTAGRSAFPLSMTSTSNLQPHAPSPAVADLGSR
jgi:hypothetical protein